MVLELLASLVLSGSVSDACRSRLPRYLQEGASGWEWTHVAEAHACKDGADLATEWFDDASATGGYVEGRSLRPEKLEAALKRGGVWEFRRCVIDGALVLRELNVEKLVFDQCEFRGRIDLLRSQVRGDAVFRSVVFHDDVEIAGALVGGQLAIEASVIGGSLLLGGGQLPGGLRVEDSRIAGAVVLEPRSAATIEVSRSRILGDTTLRSTSVGDLTEFRNVEWDRSAVISVDRATLGQGLRFDSCSFDGAWRPTQGAKESALVRLSDATLGGVLSLREAASGHLPELAVSQSIIPGVRLPPWSIARTMVQGGTPLHERALDDRIELLQLVEASYRQQGRANDARLAAQELRIVAARRSGTLHVVITRVRQVFGTGIGWWVATAALYVLLYFVKAVPWGVAPEGSAYWARLVAATSLGLGGFFQEPPSAVAVPAGFRVSQRLLGMAYGLLFSWVLADVLRQ